MVVLTQTTGLLNHLKPLVMLCYVVLCTCITTATLLYHHRNTPIPRLQHPYTTKDNSITSQAVTANTMISVHCFIQLLQTIILLQTYCQSTRSSLFQNLLCLRFETV